MPDGCLAYGDAFWEIKLGHDLKKLPLWQRQHAIFSLLTYLQVSLLQFLIFAFTSPIKAVRTRAGRFVSQTPSATDEDNIFPPATLLKAWYTNFPKRADLLDSMIKPYAVDAVVKESNTLIEDKAMQLKS